MPSKIRERRLCPLTAYLGVSIYFMERIFDLGTYRLAYHVKHEGNLLVEEPQNNNNNNNNINNNNNNNIDNSKSAQRVL